MTRWRKLAALFLLSATWAYAQASDPIRTYDLHTQKLLRNHNQLIYDWCVGPDNSILFLLPLADRDWTLKRVTGWQAPKPREETLTLNGEPPQSGEYNGASLTITPSGKLAIVRVRLLSFPQPYKGVNEYLAFVIDLQSFRIIHRVLSSDSLLDAKSDWKFLSDDMALASGYDPAGAQAHSGAIPWKSGVLSPSDLKSDITCEYGVAFPHNPTGLGLTVSTPSEDCAALLKKTGISSIEELQRRPDADTRFVGLAGPNCGLKDSTTQIALYECGTEHRNDWDDGFFAITTSRAYKLLSIPDGKTLISVPIPFWRYEISAKLGASGTQDYLLIFQNGGNLRVYRVPPH